VTATLPSPFQREDFDSGAGSKRQRLPRRPHLAFVEPRGAGIVHVAVDHHHAFLAGIGIDAGEAEGERRIELGANVAQPVEHGLAGYERHVKALDPVRLVGGAALNKKGRVHAEAPASFGACGALLADSASLPSRSAMS